MAKSKSILWGLTAGISIYKSLDLMSTLKKQGYSVHVIMSENAKKFVTPLTFETITGNPVYSDTFQDPLIHTQLAEVSDLLIIAPASYNYIGKIASGIADDLLTTVTAAFPHCKIIAPAMNHYMYENPIIRNNIEKLLQFGYHFIEPDFGDLACGYTGTGRLRNHNDLLRMILNYKEWTNPSLQNYFKGKKIIVTAGGTLEMIDPVRYIGNISSGKMGIALAHALHDLGASVTLIYSNITVPLPQSTNRFKKIKALDARDLLRILQSKIEEVDILFMTAAVGDFRVKNFSENKIKKKKEDTLSLEFIQNPDILQSLSTLKQDHQIFIGFAAESEHVMEYAQSKLHKKKLDLIVANDISRKDIAFNSQDNEGHLIFSDGSQDTIGKKDKYLFSMELLKKVAQKFPSAT